METSGRGFVIEYEFSVGSILSRTWTILFQNPGVFFGLALAAAVPGAIIDTMSTRSESPGNPSWIVDSILSLIIQGGIAYAVYQGLRDKAVSMGEAVSFGMSNIGTLILLALLSGICILVGFVALILPGLILMCMWAVVVQACVIEGLGVMDSLKRSAELTQGYRLQILGLLIIVGVVMAGLTALTVNFMFTLSPTIGVLLLSLGLVPLVAFKCVMTAIIYADLRAVKEGATIDSLVNVFD